MAHVLVIPYPAPGHLFPILDLCNQLALRGLTLTILVTPKNLPLLKPLLSLHPSTEALVLPFPSHPDIPPGIENMQELPLSFIPSIRNVVFSPLNAHGTLGLWNALENGLKACENFVVENRAIDKITLTRHQMNAIADALESSGVRFVWSVKDPMKGVNNMDEYGVIPDGFEDRVAGEAYRPTWVAVRVCEGLKTVPDSVNLAKVLAESVNNVAQHERTAQAMKLGKLALSASKPGGSSHTALDEFVKKLSN
ncbi:hypothetical protein FNV43_RR00352 [Rhamnella rubrinervis]|uniref:UDP-glycosyltransferase n=1 Tax=Rhamnella rubrinervis TaxID=2594499 RepID=A0A8K0HNH8_9ROSA|nr:hypothetical protein FNV43_RR00352 [Rhamnella rubrinervis]